MTPKWAWSGLGIALAAIVAAVFVYPHQMVSPGNLNPVHAELQQNCFACHAPFAGASPERCIACHTVAEIGRRTTKGAPISIAARRPPFHQSLAAQDCMACHTDHPRPNLTQKLDRSFEHEMLEPKLRALCANCHSAPANDLHRGADLPCGQCHRTEAWKPASFDHSRYFSLARPHDASCSTCHLGGDFRRFTCYGCHEHQAGPIEARHREEGIRDIENCVRCHRSAEGEHGDARRESRGEGRGDD